MSSSNCVLSACPLPQPPPPSLLFLLEVQSLISLLSLFMLGQWVCSLAAELLCLPCIPLNRCIPASWRTLQPPPPPPLRVFTRSTFTFYSPGTSSGLLPESISRFKQTGGEFRHRSLVGRRTREPLKAARGGLFLPGQSHRKDASCWTVSAAIGDVFMNVTHTCSVLRPRQLPASIILPF